MGAHTKCRLGVLAAPGWIDPTAQEIITRHPGDVLIAQTILGPVGFDYSFEQIRASESQIVKAAQLLAQAGCDVIIQVGPGFAYQIGETPAGARALARRVTDSCGIPVILNGVAVLDSLEESGATDIAVACPYYNPAWKAKMQIFLETAGYHVLAIRNMVDQGLYATQQDVDMKNWQFDDGQIINSVVQTHAEAAGAGAILVTGSGIRSIAWVSRLSESFGVPIVAADHALYRSFAKFAGLVAQA